VRAVWRSVARCGAVWCGVRGGSSGHPTLSRQLWQPPQSSAEVHPGHAPQRWRLASSPPCVHITWLWQTRCTHACFFTPGPPYFGLSRQLWQAPQSRASTQELQEPQRMRLVPTRGATPTPQRTRPASIPAGYGNTSPPIKLGASAKKCDHLSPLTS
jgi:hypothetical protein